MGKKKKYDYLESDTSPVMIVLYIISLIVCVCLVIKFISGSKKKDRLYTEGICVVVTATGDYTFSKMGTHSKVKYMINDSIMLCSIWSGNGRLTRGASYWAIYLPDAPEFIRLILDKKANEILASDTLKLPSRCNCNDSIKAKKEDYDYIL